LQAGLVAGGPNKKGNTAAPVKRQKKKKKNQKANFLPLTTCATAVSAPGGLHIRYCKLIVGVGFGFFSTGRAFVIFIFFFVARNLPRNGAMFLLGL
jgi:hypothetical protein